MLDIFIPGKPIPKARPCISKQGRLYTPKRTKQWEAYVAMMLLKNKWKPRSKLPYKVELVFTVSPSSKADTDNLIKSVLDGCNQAWRYYGWDDVQVEEVIAKKITDKDPNKLGVRLRMEVME